MFFTQALVESDGRADRILVVHSGGDSSRLHTQSVCGKGWSSLRLGTALDFIVRALNKVFYDLPEGYLYIGEDSFYLF